MIYIYLNFLLNVELMNFAVYSLEAKYLNTGVIQKLQHKMKAKIFLTTLFVFLAIVILLAGFAVAGAVCGSANLCMSLVNSPSSANHNSDVNVAFNITYEGVTASTTLDFSTSSTNIGTWKTLPTSQTIDQNQTKQFTAVLNIPSGATGTVKPNLRAVAGTGATATLSIPDITINNSGSISATKGQEITQTQNGTLIVKNTGNINLNNISLTSSGDFDVTLSGNNFALTPGNTKTITVSPVSLANLDFGDNRVTITARDSLQNVQDTETFTVKSTFCSEGEKGDLKIGNIDIENLGEGGDDDWQLLDEITIEVEVKNEGDEDIDDVIVELGLYDSDGDNIVSDLDFIGKDDEEIDIGRIRDDDDETVEFKFKVPGDFDEGNYKLVVKAFSDDEGEDLQCADTSNDLDNDSFEEISVERETDEGKFIAFDNIEISPEQPSCSDPVSLKMDVYNVGDEDQDQVKVTLFNSELNINLDRVIRTDMEPGDKQAVTFDFTIPQNAKNKAYNFALGAEYDFDDGDYDQSLDEDRIVIVTVAGCTEVPTTTPTQNFVAISADLGSEARAGSELVVKTTIENLQSTQDTFIISASGFESWADLRDISQRIVELNAKESKQVTIRLNVKDNVSGEQTFNINVRSGDKIDSREIAVDIQQRRAGLTGLASLNLGGNNLIWAIGIINVILVVLIIIVAVRLSRR